MKVFFRKIAETIFLAYARMKKQEEIIDVSDYLSQCVTALVLMPEKNEEIDIAYQNFMELQRVFQDTRFYLLLDKKLTDKLPGDSSFQTVTYETTQISFYGLPKRDLLENVRSRHFNMVIDLNNSFSILSTYFCFSSKAKLRVCLQHPKRDSLYNFQLRALSSHSLAMKYESLVKYLSLFKSQANPEPQDLMTA